MRNDQMNKIIKWNCEIEKLSNEIVYMRNDQMRNVKWSNGIFWQYSNYILNILIIFWLYSDYILIIFWLYSDYSDYILIILIIILITLHGAWEDRQKRLFWLYSIDLTIHWPGPGYHSLTMDNNDRVMINNGSIQHWFQQKSIWHKSAIAGHGICWFLICVI